MNADPLAAPPGYAHLERPSCAHRPGGPEPSGAASRAWAPLAAVFLTVFLWASAYPAIALALESFTPFGLAAIRYAVASAALLVIARAARIGLPPLRDLPRIAAIGAVGITTYNLLLNFGQTMVSAGTTGLLINVNPVFAAILGSFILNERLRFVGWLGIAVSFAGAAVIALGRSGSVLSLNPGAAFILAAASCFAVQWILQKPLLSRHRPLAVATWAIWCGTALLVPFLPEAVRSLPEASTRSLAAMLYLGLGPAALAYAVWAYALAHYPVGRASSFLYLVAPVTLAMAYAILGETVSPATFFGGVLAIGGVILVNTLGRAPPRR